MPNQPLNTSTGISPAAAVLLAVAVLAGTTLAGLVVAQAVGPFHPFLGSGPLLGSVATLSGCGFLTQIVMRRLDELDARVAAQRVAYLPPSPKASDTRHLRAVGQTERVGLTPESIAAAKALARRIADAPADDRRDAE